MPTASAIIFTCSRDAELALVAKDRLDIPAVLCHDRADVSDEWSTDWPRRGNLNGKTCVVGIIEAMLRTGEAFGSEWVVKVDSDTLVSPDWIHTLDGDARGHAIPDRFWSGACYAVRMDTLRAILPAARALPEDPRLPEDMTIGRLLVEAGARMATTPLGVFNNRTNTLGVEGSAVTFGVHVGMPYPFLTLPSRISEVARRMRSFQFPGTP